MLWMYRLLSNLQRSTIGETPVAKTDWIHYLNDATAASKFAKTAANGDMLEFTDSDTLAGADWEYDCPYRGPEQKTRIEGFFYGKPKAKELVIPKFIWGDKKRFILQALDVIGDQSQPEELIAQALRQAHKNGCSWLKQNWSLMPFEHFEFLMINSITKADVYQIRRLWRIEHNINRDCRTYKGQPARNMIRQAA